MCPESSEAEGGRAARDGPSPLSEAVAPSAASFGALRSRNFRLFWGGLVIDNIGSLMQMVAQGWLLYQLTDSPFLLGLQGLFRTVPFMVVSLYSGAMADRMDRKLLLVLGQIGLAVSPLVVAALIVTGQIQAWHIYAATFVNGLVGALEAPAHWAIIPQLVPRQDLMGAVTLTSIVRRGAALIGPALGGLVLAQVGVAEAFLANTVGHSIAAAVLALMRLPPTAADVSPVPVATAILQGLVYIRGQSLILALLALEAIPSLFGNFNAMMPVFARDILQAGPQGLGFLLAAPGVGAIVASGILAGQGDIHRKGLLMITSGLLYGVALAMFALSPWYALSLALMGVVGALDIFFGAVRNTILQLVTPDALRGRVMSLHIMASHGVHPLGGLQAGTVSLLTGVPGAVALGALICSLSVLFFSWKVPAVRAFSGTGEERGLQPQPSPSEGVE